jgi:outer membrane protein TolC
MVMAQTMKLSEILASIQQSNPSIKMYDAEIKSMDAASAGAQNWMAPEISTGFWMTPYNVNLWKKENNGSSGMGQYMIAGQQMFPNRKYNNANQAYMKGISGTETENKNAALNELFAAAKNNYYNWIVIEKKLNLLQQDKQLLQLMITNAEGRYKNGLGKISAYYKAKASLEKIATTRIVLQNEAMQKRIALNTLMNRNKLAELSVDTNYYLTDYSKAVFDSSLFYHNRSDIQAIDKNIQLTYLKQEVEKESLRPQFGVQFAHMFGFGGLPEQFNLMALMRLPSAGWSSKESRANIESLKWKTVSLETQKEILANEYSGIAYGLQQNIVAMKKQLQLYEKNILPAIKNNYESMLLGYEQNTEELFSLFDAWETLYNAQVEYLDQLQQLLAMQVDLEKILEIK